MGTEKSIIKKILYKESEIQEKVKNLGKKISKDFANENDSIVIMPILKGGLNFTYDLIKHIEIDIVIDFISSNSYTLSEKIGSPSILYNPTLDIKGKHVVLADDIIDTGETLLSIYEHLMKFNPKSISIASIIIKPGNKNIGHINQYYCWYENPN